MLAQEAPGLGLQLHLQAASASDPAVALASSVVLGAADDVVATAALASRCQVITFENEWVPLEALQGLRQAGVHFLPDLDALAALMSKRAQRELLQKLALPTPRWFPLEQVLAADPELACLGRAVSAPSGGDARRVAVATICCVVHRSCTRGRANYAS
jgi:5-(carboxyamino)imidazole ribonucleotide synthase